MSPASPAPLEGSEALALSGGEHDLHSLDAAAAAMFPTSFACRARAAHKYIACTLLAYRIGFLLLSSLHKRSALQVAGDDRILIPVHHPQLI